MNDERPSMIVLDKATALAALDAFVATWDAGGRERSKVAIEAEYRAELLSEAPRKRGFLFWRRETTEAERLAWMEETWAEPAHGNIYWHRFYAKNKLAGRNARVDEIRALASAIRATPDGTVVHINANNWRYVNINKF